MKRIKALCKYIYPYKVIADIGCDHGYLIRDAICTYDDIYAYAIDNKEGPLSQAKHNLKDYDNVCFMLSDGIKDIKDDVECLILAGMGGYLIESILNDRIDELSNVKRIIVQANKDEMFVRESLSKHKFKIVYEEIVFEDGMYYEISVYDRVSEKVTYSFDELYFGPILIQNKDELFLGKWNYIYDGFKMIDYNKLDEEKKHKFERIKEILCK